MLVTKPQQSLPIYKVSATLVNSWLYFNKYPTEKNLESFKNLVNGIFEDNIYLERGRRYETEVKEGKHGKVSELIAGKIWQPWGTSVYVTFPKEKFSIRISGKADIVSIDNKIIYDLKRVSKWHPNKYDDGNTCQHYFYFKLFPQAENFYYVAAIGETETVEDIKIIQKLRPNEETLNRIITDYIKGVLTFIREIDMWDNFTKNQQYKGAY